MKYEIVATEVFEKWRKGLKDKQAIKAVALRLSRAQNGNLGDTKQIAMGISEMRIFVGKGHRIYYTIKGNRLIVLLCGGDKSSQPRDINQAKELMKQLE